MIGIISLAFRFLLGSIVVIVGIEFFQWILEELKELIDLV